jgi:hypothetical protein
VGGQELNIDRSPGAIGATCTVHRRAEAQEGRGAQESRRSSVFSQIQYIGLVHGAHTVLMNIHKKFQLMYGVLRALAYSSL